MLENSTEALTHIAAANLTQAVMQRVNAQIPIDTKLSNQDILNLNLMTAEIHKVFYDWLMRSYGDSTWRKAPSTDLAALLGPILSGQGPVGALVKPLLDKFLGSIAPAGGTGAPPRIL